MGAALIDLLHRASEGIGVTHEEAHDFCYGGKSNVAPAAASVGCPIASFPKYVVARPIDPKACQGDVEPPWP